MNCQCRGAHYTNIALDALALTTIFKILLFLGLHNPIPTKLCIRVNLINSFKSFSPSISLLSLLLHLPFSLFPLLHLFRLPFLLTFYFSLLFQNLHLVNSSPDFKACIWRILLLNTLENSTGKILRPTFKWGFSSRLSKPPPGNTNHLSSSFSLLEQLYMAKWYKYIYTPTICSQLNIVHPQEYPPRISSSSSG